MKFLNPDTTLLHLFERQFRQEGSLLVYRRDAKGEAFRVTEQQCREWTTRFTKRQRQIHWISVAAILGVLAVLLPVHTLLHPDMSGPKWALIVEVIVATLPILTFMIIEGRRARTEPLIDLRFSAPVAPALSARDARAAHLRELSWSLLIACPAFGAWMMWTFAEDVDVWTGWGRILWLLPIGFTGLAAVQGIRKYRLERDRSH